VKAKRPAAVIVALYTFVFGLDYPQQKQPPLICVRKLNHVISLDQ
jgi:hypothetical protein